MQSLSRRFFAPVAYLTVALLVACGPDRTTSSTGATAGALRPGTAAADAYPDSCTTQGTCVGIPGAEQVYPEEVTVCKKYPVGVNGPAIQVKLDVITHNVIGSPNSLTYTIQPNSCLRLWYSNGGRSIPDTVTLQEIVPAGYTSTSQTATGVQTSSGFVQTALSAPSSATTIGAITGGAGIPGVLVVFTNTPIPELVNIGNFVWNDLNGDGVQDSGEPGIPGVTVNLSNGQTTTTDANGFYAFTGVPAGTYTVTVVTPSGFVASPTGAGTPSTDSNGAGSTVTITTGTDDTSDFGFYQLGALGDFIWNDVNGNGVQDSGEPGIAGVTVNLSNGASTTTNASGFYSFSNLVPGNYTVTPVAPSGYVASPTGAGTPTTDSNGASGSASIAGNTDNSLDFGYFKLGSLGDFVWNDVNGNGVQDSGEPGIAGVTVNLSNGATTTTNASGFYSFSNLVPGNYTVTPVAPSGYVASPTGAGTPTTDSNGASGSSAIAGNTDTSLDFGYYKLGSIGDFVWNDLDHDGVQDVGEPGIAGVLVTLSNGATTTTNASGAYSFNNLAPGTYTVTVATPAGYTASPTGAGTPSTDSNGSGASTTIAGNTDTTLDFGFYKPLAFGSCFNATVVQGVAITPITVTVTGGAAPYSFTATGLPAALTMSTGGTISGTPTVSGTFAVTVTVTDAVGNTATKTGCSITIPTNTNGFATYTQGGWGAVPKGNNPGQILKTNWNAVFGAAGVTIGGTKTLKFTSQVAVQNFLPQGGTPAVLAASATNPTTSAAGVFAGQVLALQISVEFSNKGITKGGLGGLHVASGKLAGQTVNQVLALANSVIGGGALPSGLTISDLNGIVDAINNNFDNGTSNNGYLN